MLPEQIPLLLRQNGEVDEMKKNTMMVNTLLAIVLLAGLLLGMVWRAFVPNVVLPPLDATAMVGLILIALLLEYYIAGVQKRSWLLQIVCAAATFMILAAAAGIAENGIMIYALGGVVFGAITFLFDSIVQRLEVTTDKKCAVIPTALVLYLACQCFIGMF